MQTPPVAPKRKFELTIKIGADDWLTAVTELHYITEEIKDHPADKPLECISGAPSSSLMAILHHTPEQTPEKYQEQLENYLKSIPND